MPFVLPVHGRTPEIGLDNKANYDPVRRRRNVDGIREKKLSAPRVAGSSTIRRAVPTISR